MAPAVFIDLTGEDSGDAAEIGESIGQFLIRAAANPNADYGSNSIPDLRRGRTQDTLLRLPIPPVQSNPDNAPYHHRPFRDYHGIVRPIDLSEGKNFRKWDCDS